MFGFMHIDFIRVIPTSILGIALGYSVYKSRCIFIPMIMHFLNNAIAVLSLHTTKHDGIMVKISDLLTVNFKNLDILKLGLLIVISIVLILIGSKLLGKKKTA